MGTATVTVTCIGDADIITDGTGAAATTSIAITDKPSLDSRSPFHCPGERELQRQERVAPARRGRFGPPSADGAQPSPISTAIRIRSEWFLAPSFCLSSEVVLATVL